MELSDHQMRQAWRHMSTAAIRRLYESEKDYETTVVNNARQRILAIRAADEKEAIR